MRVVLQGEPNIERPLPKNMVILKIDPETGSIVDQDSGFGIEEAFHIDQVPGLEFRSPRSINVDQGNVNPNQGQPGSLPEQLF